jgi:hypothetical protein
MVNWLDLLLELLKIVLPAIIVFLTVYYLVTSYLDKQYQFKVLENKQKEQSITIPLRLQAYERLSLFCERIAPASLLLRLREEQQTTQTLKVAMLMTIQHEFEHNITQQVYVSEQLWQIIKISRDDTVNIINGIAEHIDPNSLSKEFANAFLTYLKSQETSSLEKALLAIKKEASIILG